MSAALSASSEGFFTVLIQRYGVIGLWFSTFLESIGIPFTSTVVVFTSGTMISNGQLSVWQAIALSTFGLLAGSMVSYTLGYYGARMGKSVFESIIYRKSSRQEPSKGYRWTADNPRVRRFLKRYGNISILLAQLFGVTRAIISYPAGALGVNFFSFLIYTAIGGLIFSTIAVLGSVFITRLVIYLLFSPYFWLLIVLAAAGAWALYYFRKKLRHFTGEKVEEEKSR